MALLSLLSLSLLLLSSVLFSQKGGRGDCRTIGIDFGVVRGYGNLQNQKIIKCYRRPTNIKTQLLGGSGKSEDKAQTIVAKPKAKRMETQHVA
jgi:hypothetical protein